MDTIASADGTVIAFDQFGGGPPVITKAGTVTAASSPAGMERSPTMAAS